MNLWVNRLGQLAMLAVALFFFSCEDETSLLGFKNPTSTFDLRYVEIELDTRQLLDTNLRSSNLYYGGETNRFLLGQFNDPAFGQITGSTYSQYLILDYAKLPEGAQLKSGELNLTFDFYLYGYPDEEVWYDQTLTVYPLLDSLNERRKREYHFGREVAYDEANPLGTLEFQLKKEDFDDLIDENKTKTVTIPLSQAFAQSIFNDALNYRDKAGKDGATIQDSAIVFYPNEWHKRFPGLAIVPTGAENNLVYGVSGASSRLVLNYKTATKDSLKLSFGFADKDYMMSYNRLQADRSGKELEILVPNVLADLDKRYLQSGLGLVTHIDLSKVLAFADTIPNVLIQSATLTIDGVEDSYYTPPASLSMRAFNATNFVEKYYGTAQDRLDVDRYKGFIYPDLTLGGVVVDYDSAVFLRNDLLSGAVLTYNDDKKQYAGAIGGYVQEAIKGYNGRTPYFNFVIYPSSPLPTKSVNRAVFDKNKVKLKIYYVKPTVNTR